MGVSIYAAQNVEENSPTCPDSREIPLIEAVRYFSNLKTCNEYMKRIKWPNGKPVCPKCGSDRIGELTARHKLKCNVKACQKQFSYKVGTIFEDSPLGLDKWFVAVWCIANAKNGISSHELARALGVTQKTAWFMLHRIRKAMETGTFRSCRLLLARPTPPRPVIFRAYAGFMGLK